MFAFFAGNLGPVIEAVNRIGSYFYGALLGAFLLAIFVKRANGTGAFGGILLGMASVWLLTKTTEVSWLYNNFVGATVAVVTGYLISLLGPKPGEEKIKGLVLEGRDVQQALAERAKQAEEADRSKAALELEEEQQMKKWPWILVGYFFFTLLVLYLLQTL